MHIKTKNPSDHEFFATSLQRRKNIFCVQREFCDFFTFSHQKNGTNDLTIFLLFLSRENNPSPMTPLISLKFFYSPNHTVLAVATKSPEYKDLEILDFSIKIDFPFTSTL